MLLKVSRLAEKLTKESGMLGTVGRFAGKALSILGPVGLGLDALGAVKNVSKGVGAEATANRMAGAANYGLK